MQRFSAPTYSGTVAQRVFLHIGTPKSGTTYIQNLLTANKAELAKDEGLLFPGRSWRYQMLAVCDVRGLRPHGRVLPESPGAWARLTEEIEAWPDSAIISMEWLADATAAEAERVVAGLAPARVDVVVTVRDLGRTLPSAWQEFVRNGRTWTWEEFLASVSAADPSTTPAGAQFWSQQDIGRILRNWVPPVGDDRVTVVTVPGPGSASTLLWERCAGVFGVADPARYRPASKGNESLGVESTEFLRLVNLQCEAQQVNWATYNRMMKIRLAKRGLSARRSHESRLAVPERSWPWVVQRAQEQVRAIRESGVETVGDLDDLVPRAAPGIQPSDVPPEAVLEAAVAGVVSLASQSDREMERLRGSPPPEQPGQQVQGPRPSATAVSGASDSTRLLTRARAKSRSVRARLRRQG